MKKILFLLLAGILFMTSCEEAPIGQTAVDHVPPGQVYDVNVENIPGGAIITYKLPSDNDLLYVKAEYQLKENGKILNTRSSLYTDTLRVEGFGSTDERRVRLIAVDRSNNESEPIVVSIRPDTPPVFSIFETLEVKEDFGGITYTWQNETAANICLHLLKKNKTGDYIAMDNLYTKRKKGEGEYLGLPAVQNDFAFYITDRWDNSSDTLKVTLTPMFEMQIPYNDIKIFKMPGDTPSEYGWLADYLFDDKLVDGAQSGYHTETYSGEWPHRITFRTMTGKVKLSRVKLWHRDGYFYRHGNVKKFELLGSNDPDPKGGDAGWVSLGVFDSFKPSGLPGTSTTNEDLEYVAQGESFRIPVEMESFEYYRVKFLESWGGSKFVHVMEIQLFGCPDGYVPEEPNDDEEEFVP